MEKLKTNPKKTLLIIGAIFFFATILLMLLPGFKVDTTSDAQTTAHVSCSLFTLIFGGVVGFTGTDEMTKQFAKYGFTKSNPLALAAFILIIIAVVALILLIVNAFTKKFNNKVNIVLGITVAVLVLTAAILLFVSKNTSFNSVIDGTAENMVRTETKGSGLSEAEIQTYIKQASEAIRSAIEKQKDYFIVSLGAGAIVAPIMGILGAGCTAIASFATDKE